MLFRSTRWPASTQAIPLLVLSHHHIDLSLRAPVPGKKNLLFKLVVDIRKSVLDHFKEFGGNGLIQLDRLTYLRVALPFIRAEG